MTDETQNEIKAAEGDAAAPAGQTPVGAIAADDALAKAIEGGYVEPEPATREDRVNALIGDVEHAMQHNAPMTAAMIAEMKAPLLGGA